jgi:hypothetical protein
MTETATATHKAEIFVWAEYRCDLMDRTLVHKVIDVVDIEDARRKTRELLRGTKGGDYAQCSVPTWWNQNVRSCWVHRREAEADRA